MNTPDIIKEERAKKGLSEKDLSQTLGISEMHVYDLESYDNEVEDTLNIEEIYKLSDLLEIPPAKLAKELELCNLTMDQAFNKIRHLIKDSKASIETLSEKIGWDLAVCASSTKSIREQPIMFYKDLACWFKVPIESVLPNIIKK
jgi:transcriptional regulator with XRE-family HTH domain